MKTVEISDLELGRVQKANVDTRQRIMRFNSLESLAESLGWPAPLFGTMYYRDIDTEEFALLVYDHVNLLVDFFNLPTDYWEGVFERNLYA